MNDSSNKKIVNVVATDSPRCLVKLIYLYYGKVPPSVPNLGGRFYLTPLPSTPTGSRPWFFGEALPLKRLQGLLKQMCTDANIYGNFTNHSLRATGATVLFDAGVPESLIKKRTGHKSIDALRVYDTTAGQCCIKNPCKFFTDILQNCKTGFLTFNY